MVELSRAEPVLTAVVEALAQLGFVDPAAADRTGDLEDVVLRAVREVRLFPVPEPTGSVRGDLLALLHRWRSCPTRDERAVRVLLGAADWCPRIREAACTALDRSLATAVSAILARAGDDRPT